MGMIHEITGIAEYKKDRPMTVLMFANGELPDLAWAQEMVEQLVITAVIAVDGPNAHGFGMFAIVRMAQK